MAELKNAAEPAMVNMLPKMIDLIFIFFSLIVECLNLTALLCVCDFG